MGFIVRESIPTDQRLKRIVLTKKALDIHNQITKNIEQVEKEAFSSINKEEEQLLSDLLKRILNNIENIKKERIYMEKRRKKYFVVYKRL